MDKLTELAREAAGAIRDMNPVPSNEERLLPYLRRAYEMGREARLANRVKTIQDIVDIANENEILRPVEPAEERRSEKFSIGDRVTIRGGALVGQDMKQIRWKNTDEIFTIVDKIYNEMRYELMADGYGEPDSYGNGCLYSNESDITLFKSFEFEEPQNMSGTDMRINLEIREREIAAKDEEIAALREENEKLKERISKYTESLWGLYDYQI
ncbi:MAG: hypothetical protein WC356_06760 [Candidatus Micrarchaeia archaeon]|jgi:hypothetical protein